MRWKIWPTLWILFSARYSRLFEYIIKKHDTLTDKARIQIYMSAKFKTEPHSKITSGYYLEFLTPETMKLLGGTKRRITNCKNDENMSQVKINEVLLVRCNIVNNQYQHNSRVLCTFVSSKSFCQLLFISPTHHLSSHIFHSEFSYIEVWFTDQTSEMLER